MTGRRSARFTHVSGVYRTADWSPRRPKSRGDCQTFTEVKGSAVVRVIKERTAGFSIITEGLTLELGFLVAMVGERRAESGVGVEPGSNGVRAGVGIFQKYRL